MLSIPVLVVFFHYCSACFSYGMWRDVAGHDRFLHMSDPLLLEAIRYIMYIPVMHFVCTCVCVYVCVCACM